MFPELKRDELKMSQYCNYLFSVNTIRAKSAPINL